MRIIELCRNLHKDLAGGPLVHVLSPYAVINQLLPSNMIRGRKSVTWERSWEWLDRAVAASLIEGVFVLVSGALIRSSYTAAFRRLLGRAVFNYHWVFWV